VFAAASYSTMKRSDKTFSSVDVLFVSKELKYREIVFQISYDILYKISSLYTGRFIMFSMITNIYNKKTKGPTLMELLTTTGKLKKFFYDT